MIISYRTNGTAFINVVDEKQRWSGLIAYLTQDEGFQGDTTTFSYLYARNELINEGIVMGFNNEKLFEIYSRKQYLISRNIKKRNKLMDLFIQGYLQDLGVELTND